MIDAHIELIEAMLAFICNKLGDTDELGDFLREWSRVKSNADETRRDR